MIPVPPKSPRSSKSSTTPRTGAITSTLTNKRRRTNSNSVGNTDGKSSDGLQSINVFRGVNSLGVAIDGRNKPLVNLNANSFSAASSISTIAGPSHSYGNSNSISVTALSTAGTNGSTSDSLNKRIKALEINTVSPIYYNNSNSNYYNNSNSNYDRYAATNDISEGKTIRVDQANTHVHTNKNPRILNRKAMLKLQILNQQFPGYNFDNELKIRIILALKKADCWSDDEDEDRLITSEYSPRGSNRSPNRSPRSPNRSPRSPKRSPQPLNSLNSSEHSSIYCRSIIRTGSPKSGKQTNVEEDSVAERKREREYRESISKSVSVDEKEIEDRLSALSKPQKDIYQKLLLKKPPQIKITTPVADRVNYIHELMDKDRKHVRSLLVKKAVHFLVEKRRREEILSATLEKQHLKDLSSIAAIAINKIATMTVNKAISIANKKVSVMLTKERIDKEEEEARFKKAISFLKKAYIRYKIRKLIKNVMYIVMKLKQERERQAEYEHDCYRIRTVYRSLNEKNQLKEWQKLNSQYPTFKKSDEIYPKQNKLFESYYKTKTGTTLSNSVNGKKNSVGVAVTNVFRQIKDDNCDAQTKQKMISEYLTPFISRLDSLYLQKDDNYAQFTRQTSSADNADTYRNSYSYKTTINSSPIRSPRSINAVPFAIKGTDHFTLPDRSINTPEKNRASDSRYHGHSNRQSYDQADKESVPFKILQSRIGLSRDGVHKNLLRCEKYKSGTQEDKDSIISAAVRAATAARKQKQREFMEANFVNSFDGNQNYSIDEDVHMNMDIGSAIPIANSYSVDGTINTINLKSKSIGNISRIDLMRSSIDNN